MSTKTTPDVEAQAVILREAGYSCPAIAEKLDLSLSTTKRILKRRSAVAGAATESLVEQARQGMLNTAFDLDAVQQHAAALVLDDLALSRMIRGKVVEVIEGLDLSTSTPYQAMRTSYQCAPTLGSMSFTICPPAKRLTFPVSYCDEQRRTTSVPF